MIGAAAKRVGLGAGVLLAVLLLAALAGCSGKKDDTADPDTSTGDTTVTTIAEGEPVPGGKVVFGMAGESDGFAPASSRFGPSATTVARAVFDPITSIDPEGIAQPYLVESIEPCAYDVATGECPDEGTLQDWTLTMRDEEITFHNGDVLTSELLAGHITAVKDSLLTGAAFRPIDTVEAVDDSHVVVHTKTPWGTFPAILSSQAGYVAHPDSTPDHPIGTGPFVFDEWVQDDHVDVVRNDNYWRPGLPYLDAVEFRPLPDSATRKASLEAGDIDMLHTNSASDLMAVGKDGTGVEDGFRAYFDGSAGEEMHVMLNSQTGPTADQTIREALALATDRQALIDNLYDGFFEVADGPFDKESFWWSDAGWPEADPAKATELVDAWEAENGPLDLTLQVVSSPENLELAQAVTEQWSQAGIEAEIESLTETDFGNRLILGEYQALLFPFYNRSDPDETYHFWDPDGIGEPGKLSLNLARFTDDTVAAALEAGRESGDPEERKNYYATVWQDWAKEFPFIWIYHGTYVLIASDDIHGLQSFTFPNGDPAELTDWGAPFLTSVWRE